MQTEQTQKKKSRRQIRKSHLTVSAAMPALPNRQSKAGTGETKDTAENPPGVKFPPKALEHKPTDQGQS